MRHRLLLVGLFLTSLVFTLGEPVRAQVVEVPTFTAGTPTFSHDLGPVDVAVGTDGNLMFLWAEYDNGVGTAKAVTRRVSAGGVPIGPALRADTSAHVFEPFISSDTRGGFVGGWQWIRSGLDYEFFGRFFDGSGNGMGADFEIDLENAGPTASGTVAGLPSGAVFAWRQQSHLWGRLYDTARQPRGDAFQIGDVGAAFDLDVDRMPDGGFVAVWTNSDDPTGTQSWARVYGPDGQPRGAQFAVDADSWVRRVAASPRGGLAATGYRWHGDDSPAQLWVRRFTNDGVFLGEDLIDTPLAGVIPEGDLAFDDEGNLYVAWSEYVYQEGRYLPARGRAYDVSGNPLGPPFPIEPQDTVYRPHVASMPGGRFVTAWAEYGRARANIISLCTPGVSLCGDGIVTSQCEQCDDGASNSDTAPNACRTDCRRARCGDGVVASGEECDDGNTIDGDCCSSSCLIEPDTDGDGICDPGDNCPIFPNPDQTHPEVCTAKAYDKLTADEAARFDGGLDEFADIETPERGLGPVFNGASCAECHNRPTIGGSSQRFVTRFGRTGPTGFDPMTDHGGSLVQARGISTEQCSVAGEVVPPEATFVTRRDTPPLFGLGLVDAIPDDRILRYADPDDRNHDGIAGRPSMIGGRVGRFGWKAQVATLHDFAGEAYLNEMGITSPEFPAELNPQGGPVVCDSVADPEDDGSNVTAFEDFMTLLAPLPSGAMTPRVRSGRALFRRIKCDACHVDKLRTGRSSVRALRNRPVKLFSDLLLHDMGAGLADGIEQGVAKGSEFRTAPLWGVAQSAPYLHDGRAPTLEQAIAAHGGEAAQIRDRFLALGSLDRAALIAYLESL